MLTMAHIRDILHKIFYNGDPEKLTYVRPLETNWYIPEIDSEETAATWIGYVILNHDPKPSRYQIQKCVRTNVRITFFGPQAEEFVDSTLFWDEKRDIVELFAKHNAVCEKGLALSKPFNADSGLKGLIWMYDFVVFHSFEKLDLPRDTPKDTFAQW